MPRVEVAANLFHRRRGGDREFSIGTKRRVGPGTDLRYSLRTLVFASPTLLDYAHSFVLLCSILLELDARTVLLISRRTKRFPIRSTDFSLYSLNGVSSICATMSSVKITGPYFSHTFVHLIFNTEIMNGKLIQIIIFNIKSHQ